MASQVVVVTGGGTGGHFFPALAVLDTLRKRFPELRILYIGLDRERERQEIEQRAIPFYGLTVEGLKRQITFRNARALIRGLIGWFRCLWILRKERRGIVFGVGGYVSAPAMAAGKILGWKLVLHEQNTVPGLVNRLLARRCDSVLITFKKTQEFWKGVSCIHTGYPLRLDFIEESKRLEMRKATASPAVLVIGGSQGAQKLVETAMAAFQKLQESGVVFSAAVQTGERNYDWALALPCPPQVALFPFIENMAEAYAKADLVISRAGAGSLSEIAFWGLPAVLVPYPFASEDHQRVNAELFAQAGAAKMFLQSELTVERLADTVALLLMDKNLRMEMGTKARALGCEDAADRIADEIQRWFEPES